MEEKIRLNCFGGAFTFLITFEAVSPRGDELLPFDEGVGESVVEGPTLFTATGEGSLKKEQT